MAVAVGPSAAQTHIENLPRLGEAAGDELSPAAERRLGEQIMRELRRERAFFDDAEVDDFLNRFGAKLTSAPAAAGYDFDFFAVLDTTVNAFALPGGYIGVHTGLITTAQSESELAAVLAHEIGHVTQRHIARMLAQQRQSSMMMLAALVLGVLAARSNPQAIGGFATLGDQVARSTMLSFSRDAEREADRVGLEIMQHGGFDPTAAVTFFGRLQQIGRVYENNAPAYMRTHPLTTERISDLQLRIREARYRQRVDSLDFRLIQAKLRAIGDSSIDGARNARQTFERLTQQGGRDDPAAWFGLATVAFAQRDFAAGEQ
ncbi:MAG TPA: M48 family metalloprotease, partial [Burkholderiaceae bacterium]|nr:M48 family metalloprotease [Burkholderiaceae bacterium]